MKLFKLSAFVLGFLLLLQGVSPVYASESVQSYAAEDYLSARLQANITNHRILIVSELSETSTTWVNPDGTLTTDSFGAPVRVRDSSGEYGWRDLDFTLVFDDSGFVRAKSGKYDLRVSGGGSAIEIQASGLVSITGADGEQFGFSWDGALPKPVLVDENARFVDVLPNVDLLVRLDPSGGAVGGFMKAGVKINEEKIPRSKMWSTLGEGTLTGAIEGAIGFRFGKLAERLLMKSKKIINITKTRRGKWGIDVSTGIAVDTAITYSPEAIKVLQSYVQNSKQ